MTCLRNRIRPGFAAAIAAGVLAASAFPAAAKVGSCEDPIVVGTSISSTGTAARDADRWRELTVAFTQAINGDGGIAIPACGRKLPLQFYIYDDSSQAANAAVLYERMATTDKVDFLVGPDGPALAAAAMTVADKYKIPLILSNVGDPRVADRGGKYVFATPVATVENRSTRYFDMLTQQSPRPRTIFFIADDDPVIAAYVEFWRARAAASGLKVLDSVPIPAREDDYTGLILKLRLRHPDAIYIASTQPSSLRLIEQMRALNIRARDVHHAFMPGTVSLSAGSAIEGITADIPWYPGVAGPYRAAAEQAVTRAGIDPYDSPGTASRLAAYLVLVQAIERVGTIDREKVRAALDRGVFDTPFGRIAFDETGFAGTTGAFTIQIQDGRPVVVWPPEIATGRYRFPAPSWN